MPKILNLNAHQKLIRLRKQKMNYYYKKKRSSYVSNHKKLWLKVMRELKHKYFLKRGIDLIVVKRKRRYCLKRIEQLKRNIEKYDKYLN